MTAPRPAPGASELFKVFFGVDPGASGAIAAIREDGTPLGWASGEDTDADLLLFLRAHTFAECGTCADCGHKVGERWSFAVLEEVGAKPRIAPNGQRVSMGASSAFTFGASYGRLGMALVAAGIPFERVLPVKWQTAMRCRTRGDKRVSKARAQELLPGERITHRNADAYLLSLYCRQIHGGLSR